MRKTLEEILAPKPEARPRIYAYRLATRRMRGCSRWGKLRAA